MQDSIKKERFEPAYAQLAGILLREIAEGVYPQGSKIPSESSISKKYGLSLMTVRQAIAVLMERGLLERVQGSGTFVKPLRLTESRFDLDSLRDIFNDPERTQVKVLQLSLERADAQAAEILQLPPKARVILIRRILHRDNKPVMFHEGRIRCDPHRPLVEAELNLGPLSDLFRGHGGGTAKKGELSVLPAVLSEEGAVLLNRPVGTPVFRLEYVVHDFDDTPFGWGWFIASPEVMTLRTRLGLWEEL
ncbi:MAG: GntR family transcriptional regulator [Thermodesulfobacteriota bacterium]